MITIEIADKLAPVSYGWFLGSLFAVIALMICAVHRIYRFIVLALSMFFLWLVVSGSIETGVHDSLLREHAGNYLVHEYASAALPLVVCLFSKRIVRVIQRIVRFTMDLRSANEPA